MHKVGIFGGTFDPIHFGHINLAVEMLEKHPLDEIWFVLAAKNPLKESGTSVEHRLKMLQLALAEYPQFKCVDIECKRPGPSYTIDTLRQLKEQHPHTKFNLIVTDEVMIRFDEWKEPEEIKKLAPLIIGTRLKGEGRILQISATDIRNRFKTKLPCSHLLPKAVLDYIHKEHLYE